MAGPAGAGGGSGQKWGRPAAAAANAGNAGYTAEPASGGAVDPPLPGPNLGPVLQVSPNFAEQHTKRIVMAFQSGLKGELAWAINALTLLSFKEKDDTRKDAMPLAKVPGLLDSLLHVINDWRDIAHERVFAKLSRPRLLGADQPYTGFGLEYEIASPDDALLHIRAAGEKNAAAGEDGADAAAEAKEGWCWDEEGLFNLDEIGRHEKQLCAVAVSNVLRNLSFMPENEASIAQHRRCLETLITVLEDHETEDEELVTNSIETLLNLAPFLCFKIFTNNVSGKTSNSGITMSEKRLIDAIMMMLTSPVVPWHCSAAELLGRLVVNPDNEPSLLPFVSQIFPRLVELLSTDASGDALAAAVAALHNFAEINTDCRLRLANERWAVGRLLRVVGSGRDYPQEICRKATLTLESLASEPQNRSLMKREEKAREKELKKQKAAEKLDAAKKAEAAKASAPLSKKAEQKAKAAVDDDANAVDPPTAPGEKKCLAAQMSKSYNPKAVEASWYEWWEKSGFFTADPESKKPPFVVVVPPPNVTGALHIGHGLTGAIEDTIVRWRRMSGYNTLWVPGVDHAGIATQVVVEKSIMKDRKQTRHDLGRENFVAEVHKWKDQYGGQICKQYRRLGASLDWSRECFTLDETRTKAVIEAFVRLHKEGLIYRDNRLGNWDCVLRTAISDIEVDYVELKGRTMRRVPGYDNPVEFGAITSFAYPLEGGEGEIVVATTRPETMLGDTAVAVHPEDKRYKHLHGKFVIHPFQNRRIPILCDDVLVDMTFGTGAVKITPAHDPNDFEVGKRHNLEFINIFTDDGLINSNGGKPYAGMKRFDARVAVVKDLESKGLFRGVADNAMRLGICSRSDDVIEPMIKPQWYVNCKDMAKEACDAVRDGRLEIIPNQFEDIWFRWLENIRDWCISRQLWWGHRVPAWYARVEDDARTEMGTYADHWLVARDEAEAESIAKAKFPGKTFKLEQDPDVLDTWFSSGLFPFSVLGWPGETPDMKAFYPTSVLETGHDILFFWVARMVMLGFKLTGVSPFKQVFLHAMIRDAHGRKMSKSLGNVIDPLEVINGVTLDQLHKRLEQGNLDAREVEKAKAGQKADFPDGIAECGADALRFALVAYTAQAVNINLDILRVVGYRQWCNKLWNVIRFAMTNLGSDFVPSATIQPSSLPLSCQWILSVLNKATDKTVKGLESYQFGDATSALHSWWLYELCDVFIEVIKPTMFGNDEAAKKATRDTLWLCLDTGLRMLHPFMPYLTEELWQRLPQQEGSQPKLTICLAEYPAVNEEWANEKAEAEMELINAVAKATRKLRMAYELQPKMRPELYVMCRTEEVAEVVKRGASEIATLCLCSSLKVLEGGSDAPLGCAVAVVDENTTVNLLLRNVVDAEKEIERLQKKRLNLIRQQDALAKKTSIAEYSEKVPLSVQEEIHSKAAKLAAELQTVEEATANFEKLRISS